MNRGVWALLGAIIGAAVVLIVVTFLSAGAQERSGLAFKTPLKESVQRPILTPPVSTDPAAQPPVATPAKGDPAPSGTVAPAPMNPLSGAIHMDPERMPTVNWGPAPKDGGDFGKSSTPAPTMKTPPKAPEEPKLVTVSLSGGGSDPEGAIKGLSSKFGGSAFAFWEDALLRDVAPDCFIAAVPAAKADEFVKGLSGLGSTYNVDTWTGSASERLARLEERPSEKLRQLDLRKSDLLVKYLDDAPQVKNITEDMERIRGSISKLRAHDSSKLALIKIRVTG